MIKDAVGRNAMYAIVQNATITDLLNSELVHSTLLDCEQSLFFFRFSRGSAHARASGEAARRAKRGRQPEKKKRDCPLSQGQ